jgi:2-haloacid dehalogenase
MSLLSKDKKIQDSQPPYRAVVFDVGEVLIDWNPRYLYRKIFDDKDRMEFFLTDVCHHDWNTRQDAGYPWDQAIAEKSTAFPEFESEIKAYRARWMEMVRGGVEGSVEVLYRLKKENWPLYAITNYNHETFDLSKQYYPFLNEFDGEIVSGEEKICKPDARIYQLLCERYDLDPKTCIFIDDRQENIDAAQAQGMTGILFENPEQMKTDLTALIGEF